jgi:hypothetical protein
LAYRAIAGHGSLDFAFNFKGNSAAMATTFVFHIELSLVDWVNYFAG